MVPGSELASARRQAVFRRRRFATALVAAGLIACLHGAVARANALRSTAQTVVVQPGDTLWSLGHHYAPHADLRRWVFQVQRLNNLPTGTVMAGQTLRLPG